MYMSSVVVAAESGESDLDYSISMSFAPFCGFFLTKTTRARAHEVNKLQSS